VNELEAAGLLQVLLGTEVNGLVELELLVRERTHRVLYTRYKNMSVNGDQVAKQVHEIGHGLVNGTTKAARVQVFARRLDLYEEVGVATQAVRQTRLVLAQPVVVRDADKVNVLSVIDHLTNDVM
jgi:hypothetical protein